MVERCRYFFRRASRGLFECNDRYILITNFAEHIGNRSNLLLRGSKARFAQVRREIAKRTTKPSRRDAHRVDALRVVPVYCRLGQGVHLVKPGAQYEPYTFTGRGVALDAFDSLGFCHRSSGAFHLSFLNRETKSPLKCQFKQITLT